MLKYLSILSGEKECQIMITTVKNVTNISSFSEKLQKEIILTTKSVIAMIAIYN